MRLVLASASPRRRELLSALGLSFDVVPADVDESVRPGEAPDTYVLRLAREKAAATARSHPAALSLAADTSVVVDGEILGKPGDDAALGRAMLQRLSGRTHEVWTGVAAHGPAGVFDVGVCTRVTFRAISAEEIGWYVAGGEGHDKAGGYAVQGRAGAFVSAVEGSPSNVIGLPLSQTAELLQRAGYALPWSAP